jgi:hypothetical protein
MSKDRSNKRAVCFKIEVLNFYKTVRCHNLKTSSGLVGTCTGSESHRSGLGPFSIFFLNVS